MVDISATPVDSQKRSRIRGALGSASLIQVAAGGLITGVLQVVLTISYGALVYGGDLAPYVGKGIGFALVGALIIATTVALFASLPGSVGSNQDVSVAVFSLISAAIVSSMPPGTALEETFYTVVTAIALTTLLSGLFFLGLGTFRLGGLVRYLPYPVVGGFLAGTGWLLFKGGFLLMNGEFNLERLSQPESIARWLPGLVLAGIMFAAANHRRNAFVMPCLIICGTTLFFSVSWLMGSSPVELSAHGWLLGPLPEPTLWQPLTVAQVSQANWAVIFGQAANITTVLIVSSLSLLLNASGIELAAKQNIDLNAELRTTGVGNLLSGLSPGFVGFTQISLTVLNFKMNARSRLVGLIAAAIIGLTIAFGASIVSYFPKVIMGAVLIYLGLNFLVEWTWESWFKLPKIDIFIIWMILVVIAVFGFLQGVALGFVAAVIMFAISCSRTEVVRHEMSGKAYHSQVTRSLKQRQMLDRKGDQLYVLQLQGFIFFGTVDRLFNRIKSRLSDRRKLRPLFVVLDFRRVANLDSTGMLSFRKLKDLANASRTHIVITAATRKIRRQLEQGGLPASHQYTRYFPSLDAGLEWCEDRLLQDAGVVLDEKPPSLEDQLRAILPTSNRLSELFEYLERQEVSPGMTIIRQGEKPDDLFFIESGRITTQLDQPDGSSLRLETMRNGHMVGEIGFYLGKRRTASVITNDYSVLYRLSARALQRLERQDPETANLLHQVVVRLLAERLMHMRRTIDDLQK